jgi:hypothetical protein
MFARTSEWVEEANPMHAAPVKARNGNMLAPRVEQHEIEMSALMGAKFRPYTHRSFT